MPLGGNARPGIGDFETHEVFGIHNRNADAAIFPVVLDGVAEQVQQHLLGPHGIGVGHRRGLRHGRFDADTARLRSRLHQAGRAFYHQRGVDGIGDKFDAAGLHAREIQHLIGDLGHVPARRDDVFDALTLALAGGVVLVALDDFTEADDGVQGRAQFVIEARQVFRFRAVGPLRRLPGGFRRRRVSLRPPA